MIDHLKASGLKPILVDEDTDIELEIRKRESNEEFVVRVMNYCPYGALIQAFVMEAIIRYANDVAQSPPFESNELISGQLWKDIGIWLHKELEAKYGPTS